MVENDNTAFLILGNRDIVAEYSRIDSQNSGI